MNLAILGFIRTNPEKFQTTLPISNSLKVGINYSPFLET